VTRLLVDTNVFLRSLDPASPHYVECRDALAHIRVTGLPVCISSQVLSEFWSVATRPKVNNGMGLEFADAAEQLEEINLVFPCLPEPPDLATRWWYLIRKHRVVSKQAHDTRLVAFMLGHGLDVLVSLNAKDFARFTEIRCVTPAELLADAGA